MARGAGVAGAVVAPITATTVGVVSEPDPVRDLIFAFHQGMGVEELSRIYTLPAGIVEGILRLALSLDKKSLRRILGEY